MGDMAMIAERRRLNPLVRLGIGVSERVTGRRMEPARLLAWYPPAALGSGALESLVAHHEPSKRLLKLVRVTASLTASCPFCVDMNSFGAEAAGVADAELRALQRGEEDDLATVTPRKGRRSPTPSHLLDAAGRRWPAGRTQPPLHRTGDRDHRDHRSPGELLGTYHPSARH